MTPQTKIACVVCGSDCFQTICSQHDIEVQREYLTLFHKRRLRPNAPETALEDRAQFSQDYATAIVACRRCGLVLRNPRPTPEEIEQAYQQDQYGHERLLSMFEAQCALYQSKAQLLHNWLAPQAKVVEVGSFVGGFLKSGRDYGWQMHGVDPGEEVSAFCCEQNLPVHRGTLEDFPADEKSVDAIAIWNTFDQLPDPRPTLKAARRLLNDHGILALRVPNGLAFQNYIRLWQATRHSRRQPLANGILCTLIWNNLLGFPYLFGYSIATLDQLLGDYGLKRLHAEGDTLVTLADDQTKPWAAWEERALKSASRIAICAETLYPHSHFVSSPWIDVLYRVAA